MNKFLTTNTVFDCAVIGNWHLAYVTAACLAKLGHRIALVNMEENGGEDQQEGSPQLPVFEPGLSELLDEGKRSGCFTSIEGIDKTWTAKYLWLSIDTPVNEEDDVNLEPLRRVISQTAQLKKSISHTLIINSQIPLGFCQKVQNEYGFKVVYIPENLRLGQGIETFLRADRTVIGAEVASLREELLHFLSGIKTDFLLCDLPTAEMIKHATNAFLATSISFSNELARIGEKYGVNSHLVGEALRMDKRIGKKAYVLPGLGFAGGTLPRDLRVLQRLGEDSKTPTPLMDAVLKVNVSTTESVSETILGFLKGPLIGKKILLLGYTYKAETNTLRRSHTVALAELLLKKGASVWGFDPFMNDCDLSDFDSRFEHFTHWRDIPLCPDVLVLMTPRPEFRLLDWRLLRDKGGVLNPLIIDLRAGLAAPEILESGFSYKSLWHPVMRPKTTVIGEGASV